MGADRVWCECGPAAASVCRRYDQSRIGRILGEAKPVPVPRVRSAFIGQIWAYVCRVVSGK